MKQDYGVGHLAGIDLREIGYMAGLTFFVVSELLSIHAVNLLNTSLSGTVFYSPSIRKLIYSQFSNILLFYLFTHCYMAYPEGYTVRNIFLVVFLTASISTLALAFKLEGAAETTLKIVGGFSMVMVVVLVGLEAIRGAGEKIFGFISSVIVVSLWVFIVLPYV